jgi:hypothetical protein
MENKLYLITGNINFTNNDPDSNSITTKKLMRLVWAQSESDSISKLQIALQKVSSESNFNHYLTDVVISEALV